MTPDDRRYAKTHEWVKEENDIAIVGITDHAQESLGDITYVELPAVGQALEQGDECGVVESVKAASDIFAPISGEVCEVNGDLETRPETINEDPYDAGWILKLKKFNTKELRSLMDAAQYEATLEEEEEDDE
jgi:glycine cleavage system H protein